MLTIQLIDLANEPMGYIATEIRIFKNPFHTNYAFVHSLDGLAMTMAVLFLYAVPPPKSLSDSSIIERV